MGRSDPRLAYLIRRALDSGATRAKIIPAREIVVDERVRLKCAVPRCSCYATHLLCPPNLISVDEFRLILSKYKVGIIVQVESALDSSDKSRRPLTGNLCERVENTTASRTWQLKLHRIVNSIETEAFKRGYYLAAGFIGGECALCTKCISPRSGKPCRRPFEARPSMEAMGIDVIRTCSKVGMPISLSSRKKVRWTGLVLLD